MIMKANNPLPIAAAAVERNKLCNVLIRNIHQEGERLIVQICMTSTNKENRLHFALVRFVLESSDLLIWHPQTLKNAVKCWRSHCFNGIH